MSKSIHPSACIDSSAEIGPEVVIGPFAVVGPGVSIGRGSRLSPHCHIVTRTRLGEYCQVGTAAVVGGDPQDIKYKGEDTNLVIGDRSRICEFVTINRGTGIGGGTTSIGSDNLIMAYVHIAHDCQVGNNVIITNNSQLAGHVHIEDQAWISGACLLHHFVTVGTLSFVAPCSGVRTDIPPYMVADGYNQDVAKVRNINLEGLRRHQVPEESIKSLKAAFRLVYRGKRTREEALRELADLEIAQDPFVRAFFDHLTASHAGYQNRALERYRTDKTRKLLRVEEE